MANNPPHGLLTALKPPILAEAAALLTYLRDELHCRVTLEDGRLMIRPAHRCPPRVLAAVIAVQAEVVALLATMAHDGPAAPAGPPADLVERLAAALATDRPWQRVTEAAKALPYLKQQARQRLVPLDGQARGLLVQAEEAAAARRTT